MIESDAIPETGHERLPKEHRASVFGGSPAAKSEKLIERPAATLTTTARVAGRAISSSPRRRTTSRKSLGVRGVANSSDVLDLLLGNAAAAPAT